jgi:hypothetical protein
LFREPVCSVFANTPAFKALLTTKQHPAKKSAGAQHNTPTAKLRPISQLKTRNAPAGQDQCRCLTLYKREPRLRPHLPLHRGPEQHTIGLHSRAPHSAAFGPVEHPVMDCACIRRTAQQTVERIDLAHQMALAQSTDRRVAAHRANRIEIKADKSGVRAHPRRGTSGLNPGVSTAHYDNFKLLHGHGANRD